MMAIRCYTASLALHAMQYNPLKVRSRGHLWDFISPPSLSLSLSLQQVSLDHLNLRLADTEFSVEAFAAFRSSQLQAPRAYLLDPSSSLPGQLDLTGERGEPLAGGGGGDGGELGDLTLVRNHLWD